MRVRKPTPAFVVAVGALVVSLGGTSYAAIQISSADINAVGDQPAANTLLAEAQGYKLYRLTSGDFSVMSPPDAEGKVYSFTWKRGDLGC